MFGFAGGAGFGARPLFFDEKRKNKGGRRKRRGRMEVFSFVPRPSRFVRQKEMQLRLMKFVMRFTVIDEGGTMSFVAPCNALKALVAACSKFPTDLEGLLSATVPYDSDLKEN